MKRAAAKWPLAVMAIPVLWTMAGLWPADTGTFDTEAFARLPVLQGGRVKPVDSAARNALLLLHGKQSVKMGDQRMGPVEWLLETAARPEAADNYPVFLIHNPDVTTFLNLPDPNRHYYAFSELRPHAGQIMAHAAAARERDAKLRSPFQKALVRLDDRLTLYMRLRHTFLLKAEGRSFGETVEADKNVLAEGFETFEARHREGQSVSGEAKEILERFGRAAGQYQFMDRMAYMWVLPPASFGGELRSWMTTGGAFLRFVQHNSLHPGAVLYARILDAYANGDAPSFKRGVDELLKLHGQTAPGNVRKAAYENLFNRWQPFYRAIGLYLMSFLFVIFSWMRWEKSLTRLAGWTLTLAFGVHTIGLISRMILQDRPPVTNLYSSAIFVGWVAIIFGLALERFYKNRIGLIVSSVIGFLTLIVAHHLSLEGDTLEMMQAVLDSNFWLSTHVVTVTMGYSATFLAGTLGLVYVVRGLWTRTLDAAARQDLKRMVYGIVCFALFFSFIGTVLGGIWADQSWGRFWGWDPKENGALLIVLWNAVILHSLKAKIVKERGLMLMAIFGNVITAFSWFGVNMLGVGLHSYGFMDQAFVWLLAFTLSQLAFIGLGALPRKYWRSK